MEKAKYKIGIIGGGAMGGSLAEGLGGKGGVSPSDIIVSDPLSNKLVRVKPWLVKEVIEEIKIS